jgi:hypothetical protein
MLGQYTDERPPGNLVQNGAASLSPGVAMHTVKACATVA